MSSYICKYTCFRKPSYSSHSIHFFAMMPIVEAFVCTYFLYIIVVNKLFRERRKRKKKKK